MSYYDEAEETKMTNRDSIKVVEIEKAIKLIAASSFALLAATIFIWTIYSFGYSRGEDHGRMLSSVGSSNASLYCYGVNGNIACNCVNNTCSTR